MKFILSFVMLLSLNVWADPAADLSKLKLYRSYFNVALETPTAEQFEVWYAVANKHGGSGLEWESFQAAILDGDDGSNLDPSDYLSSHQMVAGWPQPPQKNPGPVPPQLKFIEDGLRASVQRNHGHLGIEDTRVIYKGRAARVTVREIIPLSDEADFTKRTALRGEAHYFANLNTKVMTPFGSGGVGIGSLESSLDHMPSSSRWVDIRIHEKIEGTSFLSMKFETLPSSLHVQTFNKLMYAIVRTAQKMEDGVPATSGIEDIVAKQSPSRLPVGFKQHYVFRVRTEGWGARSPEYVKDLIFLIPTEDSEFEFTKKEKETGIEVKVEGEISFPDVYMTVTAHDRNGTEKKYNLKVESNDVTVIRDSGEQAFSGSINFDWPMKHKFQGNSKFTRISVAPGPSLRVSRLTGER